MGKRKHLDLDDSVIKIPEVDQSRWELYYVFEELVNSGSDNEIEEVLNQFTPQDFLAIEIVFDLVVYNKISILKSLYQKNIPLTYQNRYGANALHIACGASGSIKCVKFFIENNILTDINKKSSKFTDGLLADTPLTLAISYEHHDIIRYFKKKFGIDSVKMEDIDTIVYTAKYIQKKADMREIYYNSDVKKELGL